MSVLVLNSLMLKHLSWYYSNRKRKTPASDVVRKMYCLNELQVTSDCICQMHTCKYCDAVHGGTPAVKTKDLINSSRDDYVVTPNPWLILFVCVFFPLRIISISATTFLIGTTGRNCDHLRRKELRLTTIKTASASPQSSQHHWWGKRMTSSSHPPSSLAWLFRSFLSSLALIHSAVISLSPSLFLGGFCLLLFLFNPLFIREEEIKGPTFLSHSHVCCQGNMIQSIASCTSHTSHRCCCLLLVNTVWSHTKEYSSFCGVLGKSFFFIYIYIYIERFVRYQ